MITTALGVIQLDPAVFWRLSLSEWLHVQRGYFMRKEMESRQTWEQARMIAFYAVKPHVKRNTLNTLDSLLKFPWENAKPGTVTMTKDEVDYIVRKYGNYYDSVNDKFVN